MCPAELSGAQLATAAALMIMAFKGEEPGRLSRVDDFATSAPKDKPAQPVPPATSLNRPKSAPGVPAERTPRLGADRHLAERCGCPVRSRPRSCTNLNHPLTKNRTRALASEGCRTKPIWSRNRLAKRCRLRRSDAASYAIVGAKEGPTFDNVLMVRAK